MTIPNDLIKFVSEISNYPDEVVEALYEVAFSLYPDEEHKILRYYYFGFLLTSDSSKYLASKIEISNTKIEQLTGNEANPYWIKYKNLLDALGINNEDVDNESIVVIY